jgi:putative transposase
VALHFIRQFNLSQRRACELVSLQRCIYRYRSRRVEEAPVRERLKQLAQEHPRWGYRFLCTLLRREGHHVNHKRVFRLYRDEGLKLRSKRRKKVFSVQRVKPLETTGINQKWSMDFVSDTLSCGRRFRALSIIDCHSRECLAMEVDTSLSGERVVRVLERLRETRGLPQVIQTDNGPEFTGHKLDAWAYRNRVRLFFIEPGKPVQNAHIESFNGKLRNECLNLEWFTSLREAQRLIEAWRINYNRFRPHSSLNNLPPEIWQQNQTENLYV